jgi:lysophospholipase L1-like esterase
MSNPLRSGRSRHDGPIPSEEFYREYHGHRVEHLERLLSHLVRRSTNASTGPGPPRVIWTAGDSSLDNKYWFPDQVSAVPAYRDILDPPVMKPDVTYWLNHFLDESSPPPTKTVAINAAVEASTINERTFRLRPQDAFLRDNLRQQDVLIVSVGGNDVALCPLPCTILSIGCLVACLPTCLIEKGCTCCAVPVDDRCGGCGPSLLSCLGSCPPCVGYVKHLLGDRVEAYVRKLTSKTTPSAIFVCTIYYPDERATPSWAGTALKALGYNANPGKLQRLIRLVHERATSQIRIDGVPVIPVPLYAVLDGTNTDDYVARVEPSPSGGKKMAEYLLHVIRQHDRDFPYRPPSPPMAAAMHDRDD